MKVQGPKDTFRYKRKRYKRYKPFLRIGPYTSHLLVYISQFWPKKTTLVFLTPIRSTC